MRRKQEDNPYALLSMRDFPYNPETVRVAVNRERSGQNVLIFADGKCFIPYPGYAYSDVRSMPKYIPLFCKLMGIPAKVMREERKKYVENISKRIEEGKIKDLEHDARRLGYDIVKIPKKRKPSGPPAPLI